MFAWICAIISLFGAVATLGAIVWQRLPAHNEPIPPQEESLSHTKADHQLVGTVFLVVEPQMLPSQKPSQTDQEPK